MKKRQTLLTITLLMVGVLAYATYFPQSEPYDSQIGKTTKISPMREMATAISGKQVGSTFTSASYDTNYWTATTNGGAVYSNLVGEIDLYTSTNAGTSMWVSVRSARYLAGSANFFRGVFRCYQTNAPLNVRQWGAFDTNNGVFFQMSNNVLSACSRKSGVDTIVPSASWTTAYNVDGVTNASTYEIWWTNTKIWYYINDVLYYAYPANITPWGDPQGLKIGIINKNLGGTNTSVLEARVASIWGFNQPDAAMNVNLTGANFRNMKLGNGILRRVMVNASTSSTIVTIYDSTTPNGTKIATITVLANNLFPGAFEYDCPFFNGLTVTNAGDSTDITVIYE